MLLERRHVIVSGGRGLGARGPRDGHRGLPEADRSGQVLGDQPHDVGRARGLNGRYSHGRYLCDHRVRQPRCLLADRRPFQARAVNAQTLEGKVAGTRVVRLLLEEIVLETFVDGGFDSVGVGAGKVVVGVVVETVGGVAITVGGFDDEVLDNVINNLLAADGSLLSALPTLVGHFLLLF